MPMRCGSPLAKFKGQGAKLVTASPDEGKTYTRKSTFMTMGGNGQGTTLEAFRALARIMSAYPGRKNLIWVSESFVVDTMSAVGASGGPQFLAPAVRLHGRDVRRHDGSADRDLSD